MTAVDSRRAVPVEPQDAEPARGPGTVAIAVAVATAAVVVALTLPHVGFYGALPVAILVGVVFVLRAPRTWLWPAALAVFALVPVTYIALGQLLDLLSPILLLALLVVVLRGEAPPAWLRGPTNVLWALVAFLALVGVVQPVLKPITTLVNAACLAIALIVVPARGAWPSAFRPLLAAIAWTGAGLGVFAVVESATRTNPLAAFYAAAPYPLFQYWDVYRVETTLGNPLLNSAFFSVVATLDLAVFVATAQRRFLLLMAPALAGLVLTFSRSGLLAFGVGVAAVILLAVLRRGAGRSARAWAVVGFVVVAAAALLASGALSRYSSDEATSSTQVRLNAFATIPGILRDTHYLGAGAGSSGQLFALYGGAAGRFPLENSALQLLLSFGVPGVLLLAWGIGWLLVRAIRRGASIGPAGLAAYVVAATGFNLFEAYPAALLIPALLLALTVMEARGSGEALA